MSEPTTQPRPWATVAPWREVGDDWTDMAATHYAAMARAHMVAYRSAMSTASQIERMDEMGMATKQALARHGNPMAAAFTAAASIAGWPVKEIAETLADADATEGTLDEWLTAAGIDPEQIEAAS